MTNGTRYIENATGIEVLLDATYQWGVHPPEYFVVRYPDGQVFITPRGAIERHFTLVTPQEISIRSFGGNISRPNKKQRALDKELDEPAEEPDGNSNAGH